VAALLRVAAWTPPCTIPSRPAQRSTTYLHLTAESRESKNELSLAGMNVAISGAGPGGLLLAHRLLTAGAKCTIYETREDPRKAGAGVEGRAYALGLGIRGRTAIRTVDESLWQAVKGRGFESERFDLHVSPKIKFRLRDEKVSVGKDGERLEPSLLLYQSDLCSELLDALLARYKSQNVEVKFTTEVVKVDFNKRCIVQKERYSEKEVVDGPYDLVVGCDGVNSKVRSSMEAELSGFEVEKEALPGIFKVARLPIMPPLLDPTSIHLIASGGSAFVEPIAEGQCCILFNGKSGEEEQGESKEIESFQELVKSPSNGKDLNLETLISDFRKTYPLLEGLNETDIMLQLADQAPSAASAVKCNIYHGAGFVALVGDAAHATGGVTGQGCNSALMDSVALANALEQACKESKEGPKTNIIELALLNYSKKQVPEGAALYDLALGAKGEISPILNLRIKVGSLLDTLFGGKFGLGKPFLQTLATTSLVPFSDIRRDRASRYAMPFPEEEEFDKKIEFIAETTSRKENPAVLSNQ
jgi:kynurenine 3-monooxygenase